MSAPIAAARRSVRQLLRNSGSMRITKIINKSIMQKNESIGNPVLFFFEEVNHHRKPCTYQSRRYVGD